MKPTLTIDVEVKSGVGLWSKIATLDRLLGATFEFISNGGFGTATVDAQQKFNEAGFLALQIKRTKRLVYRVNGTAVAYAVLRRPVRSWADLQTQRVQAIGPTDETNSKVVYKQYVAPGGSQDLSWFYYQLAKDFILKFGFANQIQIETAGVSKAAITFKGSLRQCLTDLGTLADTYVYWGFQIENDGTITFYVRKRDRDAAPIYAPDLSNGPESYDFLTDAYPHVVTALEHTEEDQNLVNVLYINGGPLKYKNEAPNPSFEDIRQGGSLSSNMLSNGGFDDPTNTAWTLRNGASIKHEAEDPPHSGTKYLELDHLNEIGDQGRAGIIGGHTYAVDVMVSCENPILTPYVLRARIYWYVSNGGASLGQTEGLFNITGKPWDLRTIKGQAPPTAGYLIVEVKPASLPLSGGDERGILVDTVILYDVSLIYQFGYRLEDTATPTGRDRSVDGTNFYFADWSYDYSDPTSVVPPRFLGYYGSYGVEIYPYNLGSRHLRLINSGDAEIPVVAKQYYSVAITARALTDSGSDPSVALPGVKTLKIGAVYWKENDDHVYQITPKEVVLTSSWAIYGGLIQMPDKAVKVRLYFEFTQPIHYWLDGVQFNQSPTVPLKFYEGDSYFGIINVQDIYEPGDPEHASMSNPPVGYGPIEEIVDAPVVLTDSDAKKWAKNVFDLRALPVVSQAVTVRQVDAPLIMFAPNGYLQCQGVEGFTFPKLWVERVGWSYDPTGFTCSIEATKELPRIDQLIERDRALVITAVGVGADSLATYVPPVEQQWQVAPADVRVTNSGRTFTVTLDFPTNVATMEAAVRGFDIPNSWLSLTQDGDGQYTIFSITLPLGDVFSDPDNIVLFYRPLDSGYYASKLVAFVATGVPGETFHLPDTPLLGSIRAYVRERRVPQSYFSVLLDPSTGNPDTVEIDASIGLFVGSPVLFRYYPDDIVAPFYNQEGLLDNTGKIALDFPPFAWPDVSHKYDVLQVYGGNAFGGPVITFNGTLGQYEIDAPTDRVGDRYLLRMTTTV